MIYLDSNKPKIGWDILFLFNLISCVLIIIITLIYTIVIYILRKYKEKYSGN
jgi:hypothetical protein